MNKKFSKKASLSALSLVAVVGLSACGDGEVTKDVQDTIPVVAQEESIEVMEDKMTEGEKMMGGDKMAKDEEMMEDDMMMEGGSLPVVGGAQMLPTQNIIENAVNSTDHTTLVAAITAAGLVETLSGPGPFTVFAPTNAAFEKLPEGTVETLLMPENIDQLKSVLTYHVLPTKAMSDAVIEMSISGGGTYDVTTVSGGTLTLALDGTSVTVTDESKNVATVTIADVSQSNGVIHVIDTVLLPASE